MGTYLIDEPITRERLQEIANERFGDMVKGVVDIEQGLLIVGSELHIDGATALQEGHGSKGEALWGVNLYPGEAAGDFLEFDSVINLKPTLGNRTRSVEGETVRDAIIAVVRKKVTDSGL
ncbi:MAG: DUF5674 family protein [Candidatus Paceibacteria bacterium]